MRHEQIKDILHSAGERNVLTQSTVLGIAFGLPVGKETAVWSLVPLDHTSHWRFIYSLLAEARRRRTEARAKELK